MNHGRSNPDDDDPQLEQSLGRALKRRPLSDDAMGRIYAAVAAEYRQSIVRPVRLRRYGVVLALAATLAAVVVGVFLQREVSSDSVKVATLVQADGAGLVKPSTLWNGSPVVAGDALHTGERWQARGLGLVALESGGTLRLAPGSVVEARGHNEILLAAGRAYFDFPHGAAAFVVRTQLASIEHIGTQFEVADLNGRLRVRVREGSVRVHAPDGVEMVEQGTELLVEQSGRVVHADYPTDGADWAWVDAVAPRYDIENRPLSDFLGWVARETGRRVTFTDAHVQEVAQHTVLHGSVEGLRPLDALDHVLSTTSLKFDLQDGVIRVSSRR